ncbi:MAG: 30S ribosomal protein S18 [Coriobacteriaceae bacterium]|nr:30S ribosomal protein S18 [Coriobacteriaceae bacterium]
MPEHAHRPRRKYCRFCADKVDYIDYKDTKELRYYITDRGKIKPRRSTGVCNQHQHELAAAIKNAREMGLLPYTVQVATGGSGGRRKNRS